MIRRKSRAITSTSSGVSVAGVMPPSVISNPSVASDAAIQASLTINKPNNIQLASVAGFINGVNGNITNCVSNQTTTNGTVQSTGDGAMAYVMINTYNIALTMLAYNNQLKPTYDLSKAKGITTTTSNSLNIGFFHQITSKIDINISSKNTDGTNSATTGSISLDYLTSIEVNVNNPPNMSYGNYSLPSPTPFINMFMGSIMPLSIVNAICISFDLYIQDSLMFAPLLKGGDNTTLAAIFFSTQKLLTSINNACTNIPPSNPQLTTTVVAAAANNTTTLQAQISTLTQSQTQLTQQLQASQASLSDMTTKYNNTSSQLQQVQTQLSNLQSADAQLMSKLTGQTQSLQSQLSAVQSQLSQTKSSDTTTINTLTSQANDLQNQLTQAQAQITQAQTQLSQTQSADAATINNLTTQAQTLQSQLSTLSTSMDSETNLYNTTKANLDTAQSQISILQTQVKTEAALLDSVNNQLTKDKSYIKELTILVIILVIIIGYLLMKSKRSGSVASSISGGLRDIGNFASINSLHSSYY